MSREIKFRAWDKKKKKWIVSSIEGGFYIIGEVTVFDMLRGYSIKDFNNIEIMQYTGLKDKNGKEIYEGDILSVYERVQIGMDEPFKDRKTLRIAEWENDGFYCSFWSDKEIVGNIYENPELVKNQGKGQ